MEEYISKDDTFTAWRAKLNRLYAALSPVIEGPKDRSVLAGENGKLGWEPFESIQTDSGQPEEETPIEDLNLTGILSAEGLAVRSAARFLCRIEADAGINARDVLVSDRLAFRGSDGTTAYVRIDPKGLHLGSVTVSGRLVEMPSTLKLGDAFIGMSSGILSFRGNALAMRLNLNEGTAEFSQGIYAKKVDFPNGWLDGESYTGNAQTASRLQKPVSLFGHQFSGAEDVFGRLDGCEGISLKEGAEILFQSDRGARKLKASSGFLELDGCLKASSLQVQSPSYSEWYPSKQLLTAGDVVTVDVRSEEETYVKAVEGGFRALAVVAESAGMCIGVKEGVSYPCCSKGRVKAKVRGAFSVGTLLGLSAEAGILRALKKGEEEMAYAVALQSSGTEGIKLAKVHIL